MTVDFKDLTTKQLRRKPTSTLLLAFLTTVITLSAWISVTSFLPYLSYSYSIPGARSTPSNVEEILARCATLKATPKPPQSFYSREASDRYELGTNATLIKNAVIFTGKKNGSEIIRGNIFLDKGLVKHIGTVPDYVVESHSTTIVDARGAWVTPGLVDLHSHLGILSSPVLAGGYDLDSKHGPILPWLQSLDGFKTFDNAIELAIAGGVTSALVVPGNKNAIGGQAFMMKLRKTSVGSPSSMVIEPPQELVGSSTFHRGNHWGHLKQACGENLRVYGNRMDSIWALRSAYNEARRVKLAQDEFCAKIEARDWGDADRPFPESLQWEVLVDVLRGRVKVLSHCSEIGDLDSMVRLSSEFQFPIASIHGASEAWLVPNLLKKVWGGAPGIAVFAVRHRSRRESFRGSEFSPRVLADAGIPVVMQSEHPVLNSRYLLYEAQQAHYYGLFPNLSLAAVTSTPAAMAGLSHRIGVLEKGADADIVLWDSHPLQLGATPVKVWIDGILQIPVPSKTDEPNNIEVGRGKEDDEWREVPKVPSWDKERKEAIRWGGLPPLWNKPKENSVIFTNVGTVWEKDADGDIRATFKASSELGTVLVQNGRITCAGLSCALLNDAHIVDLRAGSISPGLMTYGSPLGVEEIAAEISTGDGIPYDAFAGNVPNVLDDTGAVVRAMDALKFGTRNALTAYRSGVTLGTSALTKSHYPDGTGARVISGLSVTFRTGSTHAMSRGAIVQDVAALHVSIRRPRPVLGRKEPSVSSQIAALRRLLYGWETKDKETGYWFRHAAEGVVPLIVEVNDADIMATLLIVKIEVEDRIGSSMRMVFSGASEAHLLAKDIGAAGVGVILKPARPFPSTWEERRILPGPPLTNDTALVKLLAHGVIVGLGVQEAWEARNARFDIQWAVLESNERISERDMHALAYTNLPKLLGVRGVEMEGERGVDMVAYEGGGAFDISSKVVAVISPERRVVDLF